MLFKQDKGDLGGGKPGVEVLDSDQDPTPGSMWLIGHGG
jgi:hypothetical protein